jgi:hypothetical protein
MRVLFDVSALHGAKLAALRAAPIDRARDKGLVSFYHTPIFMNEILQGFGSQKMGAAWIANLQFAIELRPSGYFLMSREIWRNELVRGRGVLAQTLLTKRPLQNFLAEMDRVIKTGDLSAAWNAAKPDLDSDFAKKRAQRQIGIEIRADIAKKLRAGAVREKLSDVLLKRVLARDTIRWGNELMDKVDETRAGALRSQWSQNPDRYPFYRSFAEGIAYFGYYSGVLHSEAIDANSQPDFEQLSFLNGADAIVSDDERFMKRAFDDLWKPRGKALYSSTEFISLIERLA